MARPKNLQNQWTKKAARQEKYGRKARHEDGHYFASGAEADRYLQLKALAEAGVIINFRLQPRFKLVVNNQHICTYVADFQYDEPDHAGRPCRTVVEDVKGMLLPLYMVKRKLLVALNPGIEHYEIASKDVKHWAGLVPART